MSKKHAKELKLLAAGLIERGIEFKFQAFFNGGMIVIEEDGTRKLDAICHDGSYGNDDGLLEVMGACIVKSSDSDVEGWLTAEEVLRRVDDIREE